jgi:signal transduction histidine kinase
VALFGAVSFSSYLSRTRSLHQLETSLGRDLVLLTKTPVLRGAAQRLDFTTERYAKTGDARILARRLQAVTELNEALSQLRQVEAGDRGRIEALTARIGQLIEGEDALIARKGQAPDARAQAAMREMRDDVIEKASAVAESAVAELHRRTDSEERSYHRWFAVRVLAELLGAAAVGFYLFFFLLRPIQAVETVAGSWELGKPWPEFTLPAIPEMRTLLAHFSRMAERLNGQFGKEKEFSEFKTKLVSIASHEFGNSLAVILNAVYLLEERATPAERKRDQSLFRMINLHSQMLSGVSSNFLNMGRLEAGKLALALADTDLAAAVRNTAERLGELAKAKEITLGVRAPDGAAVVAADAAALNMVLNNLTSNAIKYTREGGTVTLGVQAAAGIPNAFTISVSDSGIGISKEDQEKILSGYYRTESGKKMTVKGFGIGLALARQIVEAHGSVLELRSEPGKGSTFSFTMRAAAS